MPGEHQVEISVNLTGNAENDLRAINRAMKDVETARIALNKSSGGNPLSGSPADVIRFAGITSSLNNEEKRLLEMRKRILGDEGKLIQSDMRLTKDKGSLIHAAVAGQSLSAAGSNALMFGSPFAAMGLAGGQLTQMAGNNLIARNTKMAELMRSGSTHAQATAEVGKEFGSAVPMVAAGAAGLALTIASAAGIGAYQLSNAKLSRERAIRVGLASEGQVGAGGANQMGEIARNFGAMSNIGFDESALGAYYTGLYRKKGEKIDTGSMMRRAAMYSAMGVTDIGQVTQFENMLFQTGGLNVYKGGKLTQDREQATKRILSGLYNQHGAMMPLAIQNLNQLSTSAMNVLGHGKVGEYAGMLTGVSPEKLPGAISAISAADTGIRAAAGAGSDAEMFLLRAFGGNYQQAYQAMEEGLTGKNLTAIQSQLQSEGFTGFGAEMRLKQLGLAPTTSMARKYLMGKELTGGENAAVADKGIESLSALTTAAVSKEGVFGVGSLSATVKDAVINIQNAPGQIQAGFTDWGTARLSKLMGTSNSSAYGRMIGTLAGDKGEGESFFTGLAKKYPYLETMMGGAIVRNEETGYATISDTMRAQLQEIATIVGSAGKKENEIDTKEEREKFLEAAKLLVEGKEKEAREIVIKFVDEARKRTTAVPIKTK